jgi:hypothetical protein
MLLESVLCDFKKYIKEKIIKNHVLEPTHFSLYTIFKLKYLI